MNDDDYVSRKAAKWITAHGLGDVALMLIEAGRPLSILASQLSYMFGPLLGSGGSGWAEFLGSLTDEKKVDAFLDRLDRDRGVS